MAGIRQEASKLVDIILEVIFPQKVAHVSGSGNRNVFWSLQLHLAVASAGHGVFKGVRKCRKTPGERKGNEIESVAVDQTSRCGWQFKLC
jgi:hypothetical protein